MNQLEKEIKELEQTIQRIEQKIGNKQKEILFSSLPKTCSCCDCSDGIHKSNCRFIKKFS